MAKIRATFSDGRTIERNTKRDYTHAWQFKGERADGTPGGYHGFASSHELAWKAMRLEARFLAKSGKVTHEEVVPVQPLPHQSSPQG